MFKFLYDQRNEHFQKILVNTETNKCTANTIFLVDNTSNNVNNVEKLVNYSYEYFL